MEDVCHDGGEVVLPGTSRSFDAQERVYSGAVGGINPRSDCLRSSRNS